MQNIVTFPVVIKLLVKAHATHIQQMQVADIVEWFDFLQVRQGMDRTDVIQNDIQDETHPVFVQGQRCRAGSVFLENHTIVCIYTPQ